MNRFDRTEAAEIADLADRAQKVSRRKVLSAGKTLAFVIPAVAAFTVPRQALGQTGSGTGGMMMMMMMMR